MEKETTGTSGQILHIHCCEDPLSMLCGLKDTERQWETKSDEEPDDPTDIPCLVCYDLSQNNNCPNGGRCPHV